MNPTINLIIEVTAELPLDPRGEHDRVTDLTLTGDVVIDVEVELDGRHVHDWSVGRIGAWRNRFRPRGEFLPAPEQPWFDALRAALRADTWLDAEVRDMTRDELAAGDDDYADALREERAGIGRVA
jgi:hypothetical protein